LVYFQNSLAAKEAAQILGGSAYVREGKGRVVERLYREGLIEN